MTWKYVLATADQLTENMILFKSTSISISARKSGAEAVTVSELACELKGASFAVVQLEGRAALP